MTTFATAPQNWLTNKCTGVAVHVEFANPSRWPQPGDCGRYAATLRAQMLIAYHMQIHDDGTHMLGSDTYRVSPNAGYYDWRFGIDGIPHPATCPTCGRKTDPEYINPHFRVRCRKRDLTATYDGYVLVSARFREFCESNNLHHDVRFANLPADDDYFAFKPSRTLEFDAERRNTRFEDHCPECDEYFNVIGATPVFLRNIEQPIASGFFRSDLEFASGHEQSPLIILGTDTAQAVQRQGFQKMHIDPIEN
ncbi:MAG: hypothetical protein GY903_23510 [Fuerstiella sp.]|nr:hypothetical protein [Fuerstiella sp.]